MLSDRETLFPVFAIDLLGFILDPQATSNSTVDVGEPSKFRCLVKNTNEKGISGLYGQKREGSFYRFVHIPSSQVNPDQTERRIANMADVLKRRLARLEITPLQVHSI